MYAIRQHEFGGPQTLRYETVADLEVGPGQLRIAVAAAGVHLLDASIRSAAAEGHPFANPELPMTPGREVAGVVEEVGPDVDDSWIGTGVVTHLGIASGGYAEQVVREAAAVHRIPDGVDAATAVAMIGTGRTMTGIAEIAALRSDDVVVVTAAAGGVGSLLVQHARHIGATVVGLAGGADKVALLRGMGEEVLAVDYREDDWPEAVGKALAWRPVTVVFDGVGGQVGRAAFDLLGVGGRVVLFGWSAGEPTQFTGADLYARCLTATVALGPALTARPCGLRGLETEALRAAGEGTLRPVISRYSLSQAAVAHHDLESRVTTGKVVLTPDGQQWDSL